MINKIIYLNIKYTNMKIWYFLLLTLLIFGCNSQNNENTNDLLKYKLNGKIKSITENKYQVTEKFGEIIKDENIVEWGQQSDHKFEFNTLGNITNETNGFLTKSIKKEYDSQNKLISEMIVTQDGEIEKKTYSYLNNDTLEINLLKNSKILSKDKFKYFTKDSVEICNYNKNGDIFIKFIEKYNKGRLEKLYGGFPNSEEYTIYYYDSENNLTKRENIDSKGKTTSKVTMKYDENNMMTEWKNYYNGEFVIIKYEYKVDNNKNWTQKVAFRDGKPVELYERKIVYYK